MLLDLLLTTKMLWLEFGVALVLFEIFLGGIGIFFVGLGAITTGFFIIWNITTEDNLVQQFIIFFIASAVWALLLWKAFKNIKSLQNNYSNIIGDEAIIESASLTKDKIGKVKWAGIGGRFFIADLWQVFKSHF